MKRILASLVTIHLLFAAAALTSCQNPEDTAKAVAIGQAGLNILVAKKVITPADAALAQQAGQILIAPAEPLPPPPPAVSAGK